MSDASVSGLAVPPSGGLAQRLRALLDDLPRDGLSAGHLETRLGADAVWLALLLLGAAAMVPSPGIPLGAVAGTGIVLVAAHLLTGARDLPPVVARRQVSHGSLAAVIPYLAPWIERAEGYLRPRFHALSAPSAVRLWAFAILVQGILIALPVPFGNMLPAVSVALVALGLIRRDGVALLAGALFALLGIGWAVGVLVLGVELTRLLFP